MKKMTLTERAAIGEIGATLGVLISVGFLAHGINRNNEILQATNDNLLYDSPILFLIAEQHICIHP